MPLLDFKCLKCGEKFDELVNNETRDKITCPKCKSKDIKQIYEGKCYFGTLGGTTGGCSGKDCSSCSGCH
ncbi:MAG: zinc ribbon domain-containing protein [Xylanivirga thermophila]|jgi:putative FmdB family regulatory protein|uniref:FmdB family zinc ribbon protein n=1 Tax=Xylanivirga thermophila TaxID=2496273 RepID=UPI00101DBAD1|nr:zinc ribbon domain-containing protein [Xylanivirga thermophila]